MSGDMESGPGIANLTAEDLPTVYDNLYDARTKWREIGMQLKLNKDTLQCIESETESHDHNSKCLRKMLTHHLEAVQRPLTWELLCDCLRSPTVSRNDVADKIEQWLRGVSSTTSRGESFVYPASATPHKTSDSSFHCPFSICTTNEATLPTEFCSLKLLQGESLSMLDSDLDKLKNNLCDPQAPGTRTVEQSVIEDDILDLKDKAGQLHNTLRKVLSTVPGITHFLADYLESDDEVSNSSFNEIYSKLKNSFCTKENVDVFKQIYDNVDISDRNDLRKAQRAFCAYDQSLRTMLLRRIRAFPGGWKYGKFGDGENKLKIKYETASLKTNTRTLRNVKESLKRILKLHSDVRIKLIQTREGCMEVLFALFTVPRRKGEELLLTELSLQQKRDLAQQSISLLEYNSRVLYCCCMLTGDQESEGLLTDLLRKRKEYHSASLKDDQLRNHHPDCSSLKDVQGCPTITCKMCGESIQQCGLEYHTQSCSSTSISEEPVPLTISQQPTPVVVHLEQELSILASGSKPLTYQWFKDGSKLSDNRSYEGSSTATLIINGRDSYLRGKYCCEVKDRLGETVLSNMSEVTVGNLKRAAQRESDTGVLRTESKKQKMEAPETTKCHPSSPGTEKSYHGQSSRLVELCKTFELNNDIIEKEVSDEDLLKISSQLENWRQVAAHLGLSQADIETIELRARSDEELMTLYMLQEWKRKKTLKGTYRVLLETLTSCERSESAIQVCKLLRCAK